MTRLVWPGEISSLVKAVAVSVQLSRAARWWAESWTTQFSCLLRFRNLLWLSTGRFRPRTEARHYLPHISQPGRHFKSILATLARGFN